MLNSRRKDISITDIIGVMLRNILEVMSRSLAKNNLRNLMSINNMHYKESRIGRRILIIRWLKKSIKR